MQFYTFVGSASILFFIIICSLQAQQIDLDVNGKLIGFKSQTSKIKVTVHNVTAIDTDRYILLYTVQDPSNVYLDLPESFNHFLIAKRSKINKGDNYNGQVEFTIQRDGTKNLIRYLLMRKHDKDIHPSKEISHKILHFSDKYLDSTNQSFTLSSEYDSLLQKIFKDIGSDSINWYLISDRIKEVKESISSAITVAKNKITVCKNAISKKDSLERRIIYSNKLIEILNKFKDEYEPSKGSAQFLFAWQDSILKKQKTLDADSLEYDNTSLDECIDTNQIIKNIDSLKNDLKKTNSFYDSLCKVVDSQSTTINILRYGIIPPICNVKTLIVSVDKSNLSNWKLPVIDVNDDLLVMVTNAQSINNHSKYLLDLSTATNQKLPQQVVIPSLSTKSSILTSIGPLFRATGDSGSCSNISESKQKGKKPDSTEYVIKFPTYPIDRNLNNIYFDIAYWYNQELNPDEALKVSIAGNNNDTIKVQLPTNHPLYRLAITTGMVYSGNICKYEYQGWPTSNSERFTIKEKVVFDSDIEPVIMLEIYFNRTDPYNAFFSFNPPLIKNILEHSGLTFGLPFSMDITKAIYVGTFIEPFPYIYFNFGLHMRTINYIKNLSTHASPEKIDDIIEPTDQKTIFDYQSFYAGVSFNMDFIPDIIKTILKMK